MSIVYMSVCNGILSSLLFFGILYFYEEIRLFYFGVMVLPLIGIFHIMDSNIFMKKETE
jgi:hypothetical protein